MAIFWDIQEMRHSLCLPGKQLTRLGWEKRLLLHLLSLLIGNICSHSLLALISCCLSRILTIRIPSYYFLKYLLKRLHLYRYLFVCNCLFIKIHISMQISRKQCTLHTSHLRSRYPNWPITKEHVNMHIHMVLSFGCVCVKCCTNAVICINVECVWCGTSGIIYIENVIWSVCYIVRWCSLGNN